MVSSAHAVCSKGLFIAMVSANVETSTPELEIRTAIDLLGPTLETFTHISTIYEPVSNGKADNLFITRSYDP
jgi:Rab GDP dissociation inhibitor